MPSRRRPSPLRKRVGSHIACFEAFSAFTHVTACRLAESPSRPFPSEASTASFPPLSLQLLPAGTTRSRVGLTANGVPLKINTFPRRTAQCRIEGGADLACPAASTRLVPKSQSDHNPGGSDVNHTFVWFRLDGAGVHAAPEFTQQNVQSRLRVSQLTDSAVRL